MGAPGLARWFHRNGAGFDAVHIHFGRDLVVLPVAITARRQHIPYVLQTHGMVVPSLHPLAGPLDTVWTRKLLRDAKAVLYLNEQERGQLAEVAGPKLRLVPLGNGVPDYPVATDRPEPPEVLFVARMHAVKRPLVFVEMAHALLDEGVNARFTLIGPDEGEGDALRAALKGDPRISWEGALTPAETPRRMASASVYVLPSSRDAYPMSVLEAMSVGLPVVLSAGVKLAPLVDRVRCGIVTDGEMPELAAAVKSILSDRLLAQAMGERGRETVRSEFSMRAIGDRLMDVYKGFVR
jgi:glycosyltransferase involved in cell wall biosynthesis